jgi:hypothetical protein
VRAGAIFSRPPVADFSGLPSDNRDGPPKFRGLILLDEASFFAREPLQRVVKRAGTANGSASFIFVPLTLFVRVAPLPALVTFIETSTPAGSTVEPRAPFSSSLPLWWTNRTIEPVPRCTFLPAPR